MRIAILIAALAATGAAAQTPPQGDRYGARQSDAASSAAWTGPMLGWSRKVQPSAVRATPRRLADGLYAGPAEPTVRMARAAPPPRPQGPAALPDSLYAQPQAPLPAQPAASAQANPYASSSPRFYSVYREYGGQPDPIDLPPPGMTWAHRPEASLIEPLDPPKKKKGDDDDRSASEADGDWGAAGDGLLGDAS